MDQEHPSIISETEPVGTAFALLMGFLVGFALCFVMFLLVTPVLVGSWSLGKALAWIEGQ